MTRKATPVGINHVALEVGDIEGALEFYRGFLDLEVTSQSEKAAFVYFGDQFINFMAGKRQGPDEGRHFGIAVDDKPLAIEMLKEMGVQLLDGPFTDFLDPWGNRIVVKPPPAWRSGSVAGVTRACVCDASGVNWRRVG